MANVFRYDDQHVEKPNRNAYSKTFSSAVSARFGELIPVFCQPVMNGETVKIKHKHNFNFMPIVFPVQTRVRASLQYFYVRNRNVWKDWMDFQFKMKPNLVPPYLKFNREMRMRMLQVGGFLDNIGCPVTVLENIGRTIGVEPLEFDYSTTGAWYNPYTNIYEFETALNFNSAFVVDSPNLSYVDFTDVPTLGNSNTDISFTSYRFPIKPVYDNNQNYVGIKFKVPELVTNTKYYLLVKASKLVSDAVYTEEVSNQSVRIDNSNDRKTAGGTRQPSSAGRSNPRQNTVGRTGRKNSTTQSVSSVSLGSETKYFLVYFNPNGMSVNSEVTIPMLGEYKPSELIGYYVGVGSLANEHPEYLIRGVVQPWLYDLEGGIHLSDVELADLPYANIIHDTENHLRVSAMPNRHFEAIYNSWYRNAENNPFKINGVVEYNKFIENVNGGAETNNFPRRFANWQDDVFTTALHSPQHGDAPLVGLVNQAENMPYRVTFANDDGTTDRVHFGYDAQQGVVKVWADNPSDGKSDGYVGQLQEAMMEAVKFGISINDFRNVNSFQRWLENNVRKGYKYRDQIKAHFGVSVRYDTLDMPEYLGGTSRDMNVTQVTQTTENENGVLGDYAGNAWIEGESEHEIEQYCDEEGYIIGILHIMPSASYSQLIPKHLLRQNAFDYYSPEFGKIGMQPILNREVAPIASFYKGTGGEVFGYQRAWYDYLDNVDSLHGKFRTQFRNFLINRVFDDVPTLSEDFLVYDPDQVNNIFYVDDNEDKIIGQILFDYKSLLPIPLYGIPALE